MSVSVFVAKTLALTIMQLWLTMLFIIPLKRMYIYQRRVNPAIHAIAKHTFIGSTITLACSLANGLGTIILDGERGWLCLMLCNVDGASPSIHTSTQYVHY